MLTWGMYVCRYANSYMMIQTLLCGSVIIVYGFEFHLGVSRLVSDMNSQKGITGQCQHKVWYLPAGRVWKKESYCQTEKHNAITIEIAVFWYLCFVFGCTIWQIYYSIFQALKGSLPQLDVPVPRKHTTVTGTMKIITVVISTNIPNITSSFYGHCMIGVKMMISPLQSVAFRWTRDTFFLIAQTG